MIAFVPDAPTSIFQAATVMPAQIYTWSGMPEKIYIEKTAASELGTGASGFAVNISDELSVDLLVREITAAYGGVDLLLANAGVVRAGSVKSFGMKAWEFVTDINCNGFFLFCQPFSSVVSSR